MHVSRFGNDEVESIELGEVYVFPKLDGTNASIWYDERIRCGSRTRELDTVNFEQDNFNFAKSTLLSKETPTWLGFFKTYPSLRLYGEWLVPHTFKGYRPEAWRKLYVFDVYNDETQQYLPYSVYSPLLEEFGITYIPPLAQIRNGSYEHFLKFVNENKYLCPDDGSPGEGIVIKNYDYYNKFGNQVWAKLIRQEFKDEHNRVMGAPILNTGLMNEERILQRIDLGHLIDKTQAKIRTEKLGWSSKYIPELFGRVFHDIVTEELWSGLKDINHGTINFKTLKALTINNVKKIRPELF